MEFKERLTCPEKTNKYYVSGSYNPFAYNYNIFNTRARVLLKIYNKLKNKE